MYRKTAFTLFFVFAVLIIAEPQTITVIDSESKSPIPDVIIHNQAKTNFIYSNRSGEADISGFSRDEPVCFQHFSYERACFTINDIEDSDNKVILRHKVFAIEEFVISANRWEQNRNEVPNKISVVAEPVIKFQNPQTAADLIGMSDEVFIQKSQMGGGSPMIRGFATNRILIVVDGVRMNNAIYREGNIQNVISLDPNSLESTEIIFGPGASVYGSDALGGVMDFHTMKPVLSAGEKPVFRAGAFTRFSSANKEKTGHLRFNIGGQRAAFLTSVTYTDYNDLRMGSGRYPEYERPEYIKNINGVDSIFSNSDPELQVFSGYSQVNTMNKLRFRISPGIDLTFSNHYSALSDVPRYDRLIQYRSGMLRYGDWYYGPQVWMMNAIQAVFTGSNRLYDELRIIAAMQNYKESRHDRTRGSTTMNEQFEKVKIYSLNLDFEKKTPGEKTLLCYGAEIVTNDIHSVAQTRDIITQAIVPAGSRYPNGENKYRAAAAYGSYKNNLSEKITLNTGIRFNYADLNSIIADNSYYNFPFDRISISNGAITGSIGIVIRPDKNTQINVNGSSGFRSPNLDDAGKVFDSAPGIVVVPNPNLKAEYAWNTEIGISRTFSDIVHFEVTGFFTWLNNAMVRHDFLFNGQDSIIYGGELSKVEAIVNAGHAKVYGLALNAQVNISESIMLRSSVNITEGKEDNDIPLRHASPVFGATHLVYDRMGIKADLYAVYNGPKKFSRMAPSETSKPYLYATDSNGNPWSPGWYTINLKISYDFSKWGTVNGGIENILNYRYRPYSSGIVAPGRNVIIALRLFI